MAVKDLLTDLSCKNAASEGVKIRKLHDGQGLYLWVYESPFRPEIGRYFNIPGHYAHQ